MLKGILMNTEMVKAILAGRKTVTRRLIKPQPPIVNEPVYLRYVKEGIARFGCGTPGNSSALCDRKLPYQVGDVLYVRETWCKVRSITSGAERYFYRADDNGLGCCWRPSIHMPKEAARIFLRVTDVRVEHLQDITDEQVIAEGIDIPKTASCEERCLLAFARYLKLWDSTIKKSDLDKYGWEANPWVWVIGFERISKEEALKNA